MGQAKRRGDFFARLEQSRAEKARKEADALREEEAWDAYVAAMTVPLELGEKVSYHVARGYLTQIERSGVDAPMPPCSMVNRQMREAAMRINDALKVVRVTRSGQVSCVPSFRTGGREETP